MSKKHHRLGSFFNPHKSHTYRGFKHFLLWKLGYYNEPHSLEAIPKDFIYPNPIVPIDENFPSITWINHSSFLVQLGGKNFLLDPIWSERCSPFSFFGPRRKHPPSPLIDELPSIDFVIISHNHYDHLDKQSLHKLYARHPKIVWVIPLGLKKWFMKLFPTIEKKHLVEMDWRDSYSLDGFTFHAVPAQHFSGRGLFDRNKTLWMGCVVEEKKLHKKTFYFAGDTGYNPVDFKEIGNRYQKIDLSIIPIGVYIPRQFMQPVHVNPNESILIHQEVGSKLSVASHWKTFRLSDEDLDRPPFDLYQALKKSNIPFEQFRVLNPGQKINW